MLSLARAWIRVPFIAGALGAVFSLALPAQGEALIGETRIARWQDDKTAAFLLMFDDSWPSHWQVAVPELVKRGMTATFYINPGKGEYKQFKDKWEKEVWKQGMAYGNHTMTHKGVKDFAEADRDIGDCTSAILSMIPGKNPRLISWGLPGVPVWGITPAQTQQLLDKYHLISRPDFKDHGAVYHLKTTTEVLALADKAIAKKGMEYLVIHGVERITPNWKYQDFWAFKQSVFLPILDGLKERSDKGDLWITDHISQHQYEKERDTATVKTLEATDQKIRIGLTATADPKLYDLPLTLITQVPKSWKQAKITQGDQSVTAAVTDGAIRFQAVPNGGLITIVVP